MPMMTKKMMQINQTKPKQNQINPKPKQINQKQKNKKALPFKIQFYDIAEDKSKTIKPKNANDDEKHDTDQSNMAKVKNMASNFASGSEDKPKTIKLKDANDDEKDDAELLLQRVVLLLCFHLEIKIVMKRNQLKS
eukprot:453827_1